MKKNPTRRFTWSVAIAVLIATTLGLIWHLRAPLRDPIVHGAAMSTWVWKLAEKWTPEHSTYYYSREIHAALREDRDAAIQHLIAVLHNGSLVLDKERGWLAQHLPGPLAAWVAPDRPKVRWAAVLALSDLAREFPDPRIAEAFHWCVRDSDPLVRKVTAYELGPWIQPDQPELLGASLNRLLSDPVADVRRDACRRILSSALPHVGYGQAVLLLKPRLEEIKRLDPGSEVRAAAAVAIEKLKEVEHRLQPGAQRTLITNPQGTLFHRLHESDRFPNLLHFPPEPPDLDSPPPPLHDRESEMEP
jgi:hypothetical protein